MAAGRLVAQVNLNNRLCSVLHVVCFVPVATLCVMMSLMPAFCVFGARCNIVRGVVFDVLLSRPCAWLHLVAGRHTPTFSKTELFRSEVEFLGFQLSKDGWAPTESKVAAIVEWPAPEIVN